MELIRGEYFSCSEFANCLHSSFSPLSRTVLYCTVLHCIVLQTCVLHCPDLFPSSSPPLIIVPTPPLASGDAPTGSGREQGRRVHSSLSLQLLCQPLQGEPPCHLGLQPHRGRLPQPPPPVPLAHQLLHHRLVPGVARGRPRLVGGGHQIKHTGYFFIWGSNRPFTVMM